MDKTYQQRESLIATMMPFLRKTVSSILLSRPLPNDSPNFYETLRNITQDASVKYNNYFKDHPHSQRKTTTTPDHFINNSGPKLLEILLWMHGKHVVYPKVLDLCAAPGGFVDVLSGWSTDLDYMFFKNPMPLLPMSGLIPQSAKCVSTRSIQEFATECLNGSPAYDLITADGSNDSVFDVTSMDMFMDIVKAELSIIQSKLRVGGDAIVKIFCYQYEAPSQVCATMCGMFEEVYAIKPNFSRLTDTELYLIGSNKQSIFTSPSEKVVRTISLYMAVTWEEVVKNLLEINFNRNTTHIDQAFVNDLSLLQSILKFHGGIRFQKRTEPKGQKGRAIY
jgi:23S rRNA U2552 (ribose-2'-O)-methylase RlmE/FtsJ